MLTFCCPYHRRQLALSARARAAAESRTAPPAPDQEQPEDGAT